MSNTGAICNYSNIDHFDMVRTGAGMLGYNPGIARYDWLKPVLTWRSKVVQVRPLSKGDPVSYSSSWRAPEEGFLATIPVGYADGILKIGRASCRERVQLLVRAGAGQGRRGTAH